jgi:hypothetical protein
MNPPTWSTTSPPASVPSPTGNTFGSAFAPMSRGR